MNTKVPTQSPKPIKVSRTCLQPSAEELRRSVNTQAQPSAGTRNKSASMHPNFRRTGISENFEKNSTGATGFVQYQRGGLVVRMSRQ